MSAELYFSDEPIHFITFGCYARRPFLRSPEAREVFISTLEEVRRWYGFILYGYVVMPEHVHLLMSDPERSSISVVIQMLKQNVSRKLRTKGVKRFWLSRYYDFSVETETKRVEKLQYIHRNPVKRGLVREAIDWPWSSFRHYATGEQSVVEIESQWTVRKRERLGITLQVQNK